MLGLALYIGGYETFWRPEDSGDDVAGDKAHW